MSENGVFIPPEESQPVQPPKRIEGINTFVQPQHPIDPDAAYQRFLEQYPHTPAELERLQKYGIDPTNPNQNIQGSIDLTNPSKE